MKETRAEFTNRVSKKLHKYKLKMSRKITKISKRQGALPLGLAFAFVFIQKGERVFTKENTLSPKAIVNFHHGTFIKDERIRLATCGTLLETLSNFFAYHKDDWYQNKGPDIGIGKVPEDF